MFEKFYNHSSVKYLGRVFFLLLIVSSMSTAQSSDYVHYRLGVKYKQEKQYDAALEEFKKTLAAYPNHYRTYFHVAQIRQIQGKKKLAIYNLKKALSYNPGWSEAERLLARIYESNQEYDKAIKSLQNFQLIADPKERKSIQTQIDNLIAKAYENKGKRKKEALLIKKRRAQEAARIRKVRNSQAEKQFAEAVTTYSQASKNHSPKLYNDALDQLNKTLELQPDHAGAFYYAGLIRRKRNQNEQARVNFEKATTYEKYGFNAHFYLGKIYGEKEDYTQAINHLKQYVEKSSYDPGIRDAKKLISRYRAAYVESQKDTIRVDVDELVRNDLHQEISQLPNENQLAPVEIRIDSLLNLVLVDTLTDPGQMMLIGVRKFQQKQFDDALEAFQRVLLRYPNGDAAARSIYNIGVCYFKGNNFKRANDKFQQVISAHGRHSLVPQCRFMTAFSQYNLGNQDRAAKLFRQFIQKNRKHKWLGKAYEKLGDCYTEMMKTKEAADAYTLAWQHGKSPMDKVYAAFKQGTAYLALTNTNKAVDAFKRAIETGESNNIFERVPDSYYKLGDYFFKQKQFDTAITFYRKVTRKYPAHQDTPWGLFQMGNIYKNQKKFPKAIKAFNFLIKQHPDDYWAKQAQWKLKDTVWENEYRSVLN